MSKDEVIRTSDTGAKKAGNIQRVGMIMPETILELGEHYGRGALKYEDHNWAGGYPWDWSYDALQRHLLAFWGGEDYDPDPRYDGAKVKHMIAAAWHCFALAYFMDHFPELDNRPSKVLNERRRAAESEGEHGGAPEHGVPDDSGTHGPGEDLLGSAIQVSVPDSTG